MCVCVGGGGGDMNFHCAELCQFGIFGLFSELFDVMHSLMGNSEPNLATRKLENWHFYMRKLMLLYGLNLTIQRVFFSRSRVSK